MINNSLVSQHFDEFVTLFSLSNICSTEQAGKSAPKQFNDLLILSSAGISAKIDQLIQKDIFLIFNTPMTDPCSSLISFVLLVANMGH